MDFRAVTLVVLLAAADQAPAAPPAIVYQDHLNAGGVAPPGARMTNPLARDSQAVRDGSGMFSAMNCDGCHGGGGLGWVGPSLVDGRWRYGGEDGAVFQSIFFGRPRGMPAYGGLLSTDAIWRLVTYIRSLPMPATVPTQSFQQNVP